LKAATGSDGWSAIGSNGKTATDSNKKPASLAGYLEYKSCIKPIF
jgi:hypothetical protein